MSHSKHRSYSQILKATSLIGGAQAINTLIGIARVKLVAILIGPGGLGLLGNFVSIGEMAQTLSGLGIQQSGVRTVAEAAGSGDERTVARTVTTLRRMCWLTGIIGALVLIALAWPLSRLTFLSGDHTLAIAVLGLAVLFANLQGGQMALIQGLRRIKDIARLNVLGALVSSVAAVALYACWGVKGIVPALLAAAALNCLTAWWFARKVKVARISMTWRESLQAAGGLVRLGLAFMWNGLMLAGVTYATRALITHQMGLSAVGIYGAAFSLSGLLMTYILGAMGADYYPRLTSVSSDHAGMVRLVNQQTEIGLLLAIPGLLGTMALAPWVIRIFYSAEFDQAASLLPWFVLGCLGRVVAWPIGFVILAKGRSALFAGVQTFLNLVHIGLIWWGLTSIGLVGVPLAFCALYVVATLTVYLVARRLICFSWNPDVGRLLAVLLPVTGLVFLATRTLSSVSGTLAGLAVTGAVSVFSLRELTKRLGQEHKLCRLASRMPWLAWVLPRPNDEDGRA